MLMADMTKKLVKRIILIARALLNPTLSVRPSIHPFVGYHHCLDDGNSGIKSVNKNITLLTQL